MLRRHWGESVQLESPFGKRLCCRGVVRGGSEGERR